MTATSRGAASGGKASAALRSGVYGSGMASDFDLIVVHTTSIIQLASIKLNTLLAFIGLQ